VLKEITTLKQLTEFECSWVFEMCWLRSSWYDDPRHRWQDQDQDESVLHENLQQNDFVVVYWKANVMQQFYLRWHIDALLNTASKTVQTVLECCLWSDVLEYIWSHTALKPVLSQWQIATTSGYGRSRDKRAVNIQEQSLW